jgi:hypothetical protein
MQLNAYSPQGEPTSFQQYIFLISNNQITGQVNNWDPNGQVENQVATVLSNLPSNTIPVNYNLGITLNNATDGTDNINSATFTVTEKTSKGLVTLGSQTIPVSPSAPIIAFQVDIGGPDNCTVSTFTSGAGNLVYSASNGNLCVQSEPPPSTCAAIQNQPATCEQSNTQYLPVSLPCCYPSVKQGFKTV